MPAALPVDQRGASQTRIDSDALEITVRYIAALVLSQHLPPVPGTEAPSHGALTAGERAVRQAYVRRERARRVAHRRALLARAAQVVVPAQRRVEQP